MDTHVNRVLATFRDPVVEARFRRSRRDSDIAAIRVICIILIVATIPAIFALNLRHNGTEFALLLGYRLFITAVTAVTLALTWRQLRQKTLDGLVLFNVVIVCIQPVLLAAVSGGNLNILDVQFLLVIVLVYICVPNQFILNVVPCLVISTTFIALTLFFFDISPAERVALVSWAVVVNALGIATALRLEYHRRREFLVMVDRAEAHASLEREKARAEAANRSKSQFLAHMSHELRTPLNAINGFSDLIRNGIYGPVGDARYQTYLDHIHGSGQHLLSLINAVLDLSKIEAGKRELVETELDLADLGREALETLGRQAEEAGITLGQRIRPEVRVRGDETAVRQILYNLLMNAIKFTPRDGRVTLTIQFAQDGGAIMSVSDTGIGIPSDALDKVMAPFGQVENVFQRRYDGTGLGLPLSRALAELHDGSLKLTSAPGVGTTATLWLPAWRVASASAAESAPAKPKVLSSTA